MTVTTAGTPRGVRAALRRDRAAIGLGAALALVLALLAVIAGSAPRGALDPAGYDPSGAHALSVLLAQQGVQVRRTDDVPSTLRAAGSTTTVFVPLPGLLGHEELRALAAVPGRLVVADATQQQLTDLGVRAHLVGVEPLQYREPSCALPLAANAGRALLGGLQYRGDGGQSCYPAGSGASLVSLTDQRVVLGAPDALTNKHLAQQGDAALGIGLLGQDPVLVWLVPSPTRATFGARPVRSPDDLLPHWLHLVRWQLALTLVVLALWRGRRLGRVVLERLPAVVRAAETVEGYGRLYRAAGARDAAADALRETTRRTLGRWVHGGATVPPDVLVDLVARRSGRDPGWVRRLLYGPTPADDAALVRLANDLDALTHEALTREGAGT